MSITKAWFIWVIEMMSLGKSILMIKGNIDLTCDIVSLQQAQAWAGGKVALAQDQVGLGDLSCVGFRQPRGMVVFWAPQGHEASW